MKVAVRELCPVKGCMSTLGEYKDHPDKTMLTPDPQLKAGEVPHTGPTPEAAWETREITEKEFQKATTECAVPGYTGGGRIPDKVQQDSQFPPGYGPGEAHFVSNPEFCPHEIDKVQIAPGVFRCPLCEKIDKSSASQILLDAAETVKQRGVDYNNPTGERSMAQIVAMFNLLTGKDLTTLEGWEFMIILKLVRGQKSPHKIDSWLDLAGYAGLAGEEGSK